MRKIVMTLLSALCLWTVNPAGAQTTEQITKGNCEACITTCENTLSYCVKQKGRVAEQTVTNALKDCITACKMTDDFLSRGSKFDAKAAALCVESCTLCARTCDAFPNDKEMKACADECRKTAGNCQKVAAAGSSGS